MKYKCEVVGATAGMKRFSLHAENVAKALNRSKRKYLKRYGGEWKQLTGHVVAVWSWLPGWRYNGKKKGMDEGGES